MIKISMNDYHVLIQWEDSLCFQLAIMYHEFMDQSVTVGIIEISDVEGGLLC